MDEQSLASLPAGSATCPSDLDLDHLHADELSLVEASKLEAHLAGCAECLARKTEREEGLAAIARSGGLGPQRLLEQTRRRVAQDEAARQRERFLRRASYGFMSLAAAAALLFVLADKQWGIPNRSDPGEALREKGGLTLRVFRLSGGRVQAAASGAHFREGDTLRFVADVPTPGHVNVLGVEANGTLYVAWPSSASIPTLRGAGPHQELPGASALDRSRGREMLYLVHCPAAKGPPASLCHAHKEDNRVAPLSCPAACAMTPFVLNKD